MNNSQNPRVVFIGDSFTGKTTIIMRYITKTCPEQTQQTVGAAFHSVHIELPNQVVTLQLWDTAGQERFRSLSPIYYRDAAAAVFVYDCSNSKTFESIEGWLSSFREVAGTPPPCFLVGNKCDLEICQVTPAAATQFAKEHRMTFISTSAKNDINIGLLFETIACSIVRRAYEPVTNKQDITQDSQNSESKCKC